MKPLVFNEISKKSSDWPTPNITVVHIMSNKIGSFNQLFEECGIDENVNCLTILRSHKQEHSTSMRYKMAQNL